MGVEAASGGPGRRVVRAGQRKRRPLLPEAGSPLVGRCTRLNWARVQSSRCREARRRRAHPRRRHAAGPPPLHVFQSSRPRQEALQRTRRVPSRCPAHQTAMEAGIRRRLAAGGRRRGGERRQAGRSAACSSGTLGSLRLRPVGAHRARRSRWSGLHSTSLGVDWAGLWGLPACSWGTPLSRDRLVGLQAAGRARRAVAGPWEGVQASRGAWGSAL